MRRFALTCLSFSSLVLLGCFEDLPPLPSIDDDEAGDGSSESGTTDDGESSDGNTAEADTANDEHVADESTDTGSGLMGTYEPCSGDTSCPSGGVCKVQQIGWFAFDICVPVGCTAPEGCPLPLPQFGTLSSCVDEECVLACNNNEVCGGGLVCASGQCYFNEPWGPCSEQKDCPPDSLCRKDLDQNASSCVPSCVDMSECPLIRDMLMPTVCMDNGCEMPCLLEAECPSPMVCANSFCRYPGFMP